MKMKHFITIVAALAVLMFVTNCSDKPSSVSVKPITTEIEGEIGDYLEIVDTSYVLQKYQEDNKYFIEVKVKSKLVTDDNFDTRLSTDFILLNNSDESLSGLEEFDFADYEQADNFFNIIKEGGISTVKFSADVIDDSEIDKNGIPSSELIKGFYIKSDVYNATARTRNHWQSKVDEYCKLSYEDIDIMKGKKNVDGRYRDELLDKIIDLEDEINYDLSKLTPEQVKQFEKCTKDYNDYVDN